VSEQQSTCTSCGGTGGRTETTTTDGVLRQTWRTCTACRGTGAR
jgi:DnaJ-class molecular chaperone